MLGRIAEELQDAGLQNIYVWGDSITFDGAGAQARRRWNTLKIIDGGEVKVSAAGGRFAISYTLRFRILLIATVLFALVGFGLLDLMGDRTSSLTLFTMLAGVGLVMLAGQYVQAAFDFASLIRSALKGL